MKIEYSVFKTKILVPNKSFKEELSLIGTDKYYRLYSFDGFEIIEAGISSSEDIADYEANYQSKAWLLDFEQKDEDGKLKTNSKIVHGKLHLQSIYFTTNDANSLKVSTARTGWYTIDTTSATVTKVTMAPTINYDLDGGGFEFPQVKPNNIVMVDFIMAPGTPYEHYFIPRKEIIKDWQSWDIVADPKYIVYYSAYPALNNMQIRIEHAENQQLKFEITMRMYI